MNPWKRNILVCICLLLLSGICSRSGLGGGVFGQTTYNITQPYLDDFVCSENASTSAATLLSGNTDAQETLRSYCEDDARCADLYGQSGAPNLPLFMHLFQTTYVDSVSTVALETPLYDLACNKTVENFLKLSWQLILKEQILDSSQVCAPNERPVLNSDEGTTTCVCQAGKVCDDTSGRTEVLVVIAVIGVLLTIVIFGTRMWQLSRMAALLSARNPPSAPPLVHTAPGNTRARTVQAQKQRKGGPYISNNNINNKYHHYQQQQQQQQQEEEEDYAHSQDSDEYVPQAPSATLPPPDSSELRRRV